MIGRGAEGPYLPKVPGYAVDELGRALVDEALLGEDVLLPLLLRVQVHSVRCGEEGRGLSLGSGEAQGPCRHGSRGADSPGPGRHLRGFPIF